MRFRLWGYDQSSGYTIYPWMSPHTLKSHGCSFIKIPVLVCGLLPIVIYFRPFWFELGCGRCLRRGFEVQACPNFEGWEKEEDEEKDKHEEVGEGRKRRKGRRRREKRKKKKKKKKTQKLKRRRERKREKRMQKHKNKSNSNKIAGEGESNSYLSPGPMD